MKKAVVVLAIMLGLALVSSVYAQNWDSAAEATATAGGKKYKPVRIVGEVESIDEGGCSAIIKTPKGARVKVEFRGCDSAGGVPVDDKMKRLGVGDKIVGEVRGVGDSINLAVITKQPADKSMLKSLPGATTAPAK